MRNLFLVSLCQCDHCCLISFLTHYAVYYGLCRVVDILLRSTCQGNVMPCLCAGFLVTPFDGVHSRSKFQCITLQEKCIAWGLDQDQGKQLWKESWFIIQVTLSIYSWCRAFFYKSNFSNFGQVIEKYTNISDVKLVPLNSQ